MPLCLMAGWKCLVKKLIILSFNTDDGDTPLDPHNQLQPSELLYSLSSKLLLSNVPSEEINKLLCDL